MKAVIFARVSTQEQGDDGHSIEAQLIKMRTYCKNNNLEIIKEFSVIESSTKGERPEFNKCLEFIKGQKTKIALVSDKVDRLQRSILDMPKIDALVSADKMSLHFLDIGKLDNDSNSAQKAFYRIAVVFANAYTDAISDNVKRSNEKKRNEGTILRDSPIGYVNLPRSADQKKAIVEFDPERARIVREIFEEYSTGLCSMDQVRLNATRKGLRTKRYNKKLGKSQIEGILSNHFYYGYMMSKGQLYQHVYARLITKELFDKCQDVRFGRKTTKYKRTEIEFLYNGLIKCKHCNCAYSGERKIKQTKAGQKAYIYMRPTKSQGDCDYCANTKEEVLTEQVSEVISKIYITPEILEQVRTCLRNMVGEQHRFKTTELASLNKTYATLSAKQNKALELVLSESITMDEYTPMVTKLKEERVMLECRIEELNKFDHNFENQVINVFELANRSYELFKSSDVSEKRKIMSLLFPNLILDGQKLVFTVQKPFDKLIEMTSRPSWLPGQGSNLRPID